MNRLLVFVLGVAVGLTIAILWRVDRVSPEPEAPAPVHAATPDTEPVMPRPVVDTAVTALIELEADEPDPVADGDLTASLEEALAKVGGDYEAVIVDQDTLLGGLVEELVTGDRFHDFALALAATPSAVAMERYQILDERLRQLPALQSGAVYARDLACGRLVCTATLVGSDEQSVETAWAEYAGDSRALVPGEGSSIALAESGLTVAHSLRTMNGFERRIVVAMDPGIRSYTGQRVRVFRPRDPH